VPPPYQPPPYQPPQQWQPPQQYQYQQQYGKRYGKKKSGGYQQGALGYGARSATELPPQGPLATDQRHAPNWGFDYIVEPGPYGYAAYVTRVDRDTPAAELRLELGDRITRINSRPIRGSFDVETAEGYVSLEVINVRTGQPEWHSVYIP
jgi:hypothetical protein